MPIELREKYFADFDVHDQHAPPRGNAMCILSGREEVQLYTVVCLSNPNEVELRPTPGMTDVKPLPGVGRAAFLGTLGQRHALLFADDDTTCTATLAGADPATAAAVGKALAKALSPESIGRKSAP